jgi:hypothetical protein
MAEALAASWNAEGGCAVAATGTCERLRAAAAGRLVRAKFRRRRTATAERFPRHQRNCLRSVRDLPECAIEDICYRAGRWVDGVLPCADTVDNDGDGAAGFPEDPDCESPDDPSEAPEIVFTDVTAIAFDGALVDEPEGGRWAAGMAAGDFDGDGLVDLYFTHRGGRLFRNAGDGTFEEREEPTGLRHARLHGAAWGDVDNDGDLDLVTVGLDEERHFLQINDGTGHFQEEGSARGIATMDGGIRNGRAASFGDYDGDGYLDLYIAERRDEGVNDDAVGPFGRLYRNRGAAAPGYFEDVTAAAGVVVDDVEGPLDGTFTFLARFNDFDDDGRPDLAVIAEFHESRLFWNDGDGTFTDGTEAARVGTDENGMGAATEDFDGDGRLDMFVSSIFQEGNPFVTGNRLFRNLGDRLFQDTAVEAGVVPGGWGWGTEFFDYDNDGDPDIAMANGFEIPGDEFFNALFARDPFRFWENVGGSRFDEISSQLGIDLPELTYGVLAFDYDRDGDEDLLVGWLDEHAPVLLRNDGGNRNDWLDLRLAGAASQRDGIGARVTVTPLAGGRSIVREMSASAGSPSAQRSGRILHFGLGAPTDRPVAEVRVFWPASGRTSVLRGLARNRTHLVVEP